MRSFQERIAVKQLADEGYGIAEIVRRTGVPRSTALRWLAEPLKQGRCARCDGAVLDEAEYAYLLGLYLGDGTLVAFPRGVWRLEVFQDAAYPQLAQRCEEAMVAVLARKASTRAHGGCVAVSSYSKHWPCLFPQAGPGRKHTRAIRLQPWQSDIAARHAGRLLAGLIHSDGDRHLNRVTSRGRSYAYTRYGFTNASEDILRIFSDACDAVGVKWTRTHPRRMAVSRRPDVELLDRIIPPKR